MTVRTQSPRITPVSRGLDRASLAVTTTGLEERLSSAKAGWLDLHLSEVAAFGLLMVAARAQALAFEAKGRRLGRSGHVRIVLTKPARGRFAPLCYSSDS